MKWIEWGRVENNRIREYNTITQNRISPEKVECGYWIESIRPVWHTVEQIDTYSHQTKQKDGGKEEQEEEREKETES